jgi:hypothetical protein
VAPLAAAVAVRAVFAEGDTIEYAALLFTASTARSNAPRHQRVMTSSSPHETHTLDELLASLAQADDRLRSIYTDLASAPGLAPDRESELRDLHARRRELAERVGLEMLRRRRALAAGDASERGQGVATPRDAEGSSDPALDTGNRPTPPSVPPNALIAQPDSGALHVPPAENGVAVRAAAIAAPAVVAPAPISVEVLGEWTARARASGLGRAGYEDHADTWETALERLMGIVGAPRDPEAEFGTELDALDAVGKAEPLALWSKIPREAQQVWLGMLVARTRALKEVGVPMAARSRVKNIISRYPTWAAEHRPGHVNGLRVDHEPVQGSWGEDARRSWAMLDEMLECEAPKPRAEPKKKKRDAQAPDSSADGARAIEAAWPLWPLVRGRDAVIVGGDQREPNRVRLERAFELRSLEWLESPGPRKVEALVSRIQRGTVDIVVLLKGLVDHKQSEPVIAAAKASNVAWALAEGYGITAVKASLDRFLGARRDA